MDLLCISVPACPHHCDDHSGDMLGIDLQDYLGRRLSLFQIPALEGIVDEELVHDDMTCGKAHRFALASVVENSSVPHGPQTELVKGTYMHTRLVRNLAILLSSLIIGSGCRVGRSYAHTGCARCGVGRTLERRFGIKVVDRVSENRQSRWLSRYRAGECEHSWVGGGGMGSWQGIGFKHCSVLSPSSQVLNGIHALSPLVGEAATRQLLERYYQTLDMEQVAVRWEEFARFQNELDEQLKRMEGGGN